ncbi:MAG: hypothetical protein ACRBB3_09625 [Alphaproteobacteria bacterium]
MEADINAQVTTLPESLLYGLVIVVISLIGTLVYSFRNDGFKEAIENLFLWFLLIGAFSNLFLPPIDAEDEITAGVMFVAFGVCRIAKSMSKKT